MKIPNDVLEIIKFTLDEVNNSLQLEQSCLTPEDVAEYYFHTKGRETCNFCGHSRSEHFGGYAECNGCVYDCSEYNIG